jgi:hypothetical protein
MMEVRTEYDGIFRDLIFEILTVAVFKAISHILLQTFLFICCILYLLKVYYVFPMFNDDAESRIDKRKHSFTVSLCKILHADSVLFQAQYHECLCLDKNDEYLVGR